METSLNGEPRQFSPPLRAASPVEALGYAGKRIAGERNGEAVTVAIRRVNVGQNPGGSNLLDALPSLPTAGLIDS